MTDFVVVGSLNVDLVTVTVGGLPKPGETILGASKATYFGGKGANQAVACARLGGKVRMVGAVGEDDDGSRIKKALEAEGVDRKGIVTRGQQSGFAAVTVSGSEGENTVIVVPGANALLTPKDVNPVVLAKAKVVSCQNEIPLAVTLEAFTLARKRTPSVVTLWNPAPPPSATDKIDEILALTDILCVNESEAISMSKANSIEEAIDVLARKVPNVIVTLGKSGVLYVAEGSKKPVQVEPYNAGKVLDTTGAGDCFCGALGMFLCRGLSLDLAVRLANHVAAVSVTKAGAQSSYPSLDECPPYVRGYKTLSKL